MILNTSQLQCVQLQQSKIIPDEGPKCIPLLLDFSAQGTIVVDFQQLQEAKFITMIQTLYIDLSQFGVDVVVTVAGSGQKITARAGKQGYYSILCPNPSKLQFDSTAGTSPAVPVQVINMAMPGVVW